MALKRSLSLVEHNSELSPRRTNTPLSLVLRSQQFDAALTHMPHGLCMFDEKKQLLLCNPAYVRLYDLPYELILAGTSLEKILEFRRSIGNAPLDMETYFDVVHVALSSGRYAWCRVELEDGRIIQITHSPMADGGYVAIHEDVTAHVQAEEQLRRLAAHDGLTDLLNRGSFEEAVERALSGIRQKEMLAVHYVDLDNFKPVNDGMGHQMGDLLLRLAAERFLSCVRGADVVARLGGDEFGVLQAGLANPDDAASLATRLIGRVRDPFDLDGNLVTIGASVGISVCSRNSEVSVQDLLKRADMALYAAKKAGRGTFRFSA